MTLQSASRHVSSLVARAAQSAWPVLGVAVLTLAACSSTQSSQPVGSVEGMEPTWLEATPSLSRDLEIKAIEVSQARSNDEFIRLSDWFQRVGESAYPKLLEMAQSTDKLQRTFAFSVIAARRDHRLLEPLRNAAPMDSIASPEHRYEMARALLMLGDQSGVPILIDGLESPYTMPRAQAAKALLRGTRAGIAFDAGASEAERAEGVAAWRQWWSDHQADELLQR